jgi:hypothetical protein
MSATLPNHPVIFPFAIIGTTRYVAAHEANAPREVPNRLVIEPSAEESMNSSHKIVFLAAFTVSVAGNTSEAADAGEWVKDAISGCEIWSVDAVQPGEGVSWAGSCHDGKASGWGTLVWWDPQGLEGRYAGEMRAGKLNGEGRLFLRDDEVEGFNQYLGRFADGKPLGKGFVKTVKGERFIGELLEGLRHSKGVAVTPEGWIVRGEFKDGKGVGTLVVDYTTEDGERYIGQAENSKRHGFGILVATDDDFYAGGFADSQPEGPGIYKGAGGDRFLGQYTKGKPNGFGTSIDADGNVVQGRFIDGDPSGTVLVTQPDGTQSVTTWKSGGAK